MISYKLRFLMNKVWAMEENEQVGCIMLIPLKTFSVQENKPCMC